MINLSHNKRNLHTHPCRILEVYIEALTGLRNVYCPDGCSNTLLKAASSGSIAEQEVEHALQAQGRAEGPLIVKDKLKGQPAVASS